MGYQKTDNMAVCRLCSRTDHIFDVFHSQLDNGNQLRYSILLATGIHIKPTDVVSKMVCHACSDIAFKLHKYRDNAIANDKLLKELYGQPYSPPITNPHEIARVSSKIIAEENEPIIILDDDPEDDDSVEIISCQLNTERSTQSCLDELIGHLLNDVSVEDYLSEDISLKEKVTDQPQFIEYSPSPVNSCEKYQHPSIQKLFITHKDLKLPEKVLTSDVSPVISLDSEEVNNWFNKQLKLPSVVFKKIPNSSDYIISSPPPNISTEQQEKTSLHSSEFLPDSQRLIHKEKDDHQKENSIPEEYSLSPKNSVTSVSVRRTKPLTLLSNKKINTKKNNNGRRPKTKRKSFLDDSEFFEVIPEKKKRVFWNKDALKTFNKMDLPQVCPSDRNVQKAIFTSSLELKPVGQPLMEIGPSEEPSMEAPSEEPSMEEPTPTRLSIDQPLETIRPSPKKCEFCSRSLENHQKEECFARIINNKPLLKLRRVEDIPNIVKKYPNAFESEKTINNLYCNEYIDYSLLDRNREELIELPRPSPEPLPKDQDFAVVYIYSDSEDEIDSIKIPKHKIISDSAPKTAPSTEPPNLTEVEMIRHLFKKYTRPQFNSSNARITNPKPKEIKIDNMFNELLKHRIPIEIKSGKKFRASIKKNVPVIEDRSLAYWGHKKIIYIQQPNKQNTEKSCNNNSSNLPCSAIQEGSTTNGTAAHDDSEKTSGLASNITTISKIVSPTRLTIADDLTNVTINTTTIAQEVTQPKETGSAAGDVIDVENPTESQKSVNNSGLYETIMVPSVNLPLAMPGNVPICSAPGNVLLPMPKPLRNISSAPANVPVSSAPGNIPLTTPSPLGNISLAPRNDHVSTGPLSVPRPLGNISSVPGNLPLSSTPSNVPVVMPRPLHNISSAPGNIPISSASSNVPVVMPRPFHNISSAPGNIPISSASSNVPVVMPRPLHDIPSTPENVPISSASGNAPSAMPRPFHNISSAPGNVPMSPVPSNIPLATPGPLCNISSASGNLPMSSVPGNYPLGMPVCNISSAPGNLPASSGPGNIPFSMPRPFCNISLPTGNVPVSGAFGNTPLGIPMIPGNTPMPTVPLTMQIAPPGNVTPVPFGVVNTYQPIYNNFNIQTVQQAQNLGPVQNRALFVTTTANNTNLFRVPQIPMKYYVQNNSQPPNYVNTIPNWTNTTATNSYQVSLSSNSSPLPQPSNRINNVTRVVPNLLPVKSHLPPNGMIRVRTTEELS